MKGYSEHSTAYRIFNKRTGKIKESLNVSFDENIIPNSFNSDIMKNNCSHDDDIDVYREDENIVHNNMQNNAKETQDNIHNQNIPVNEVRSPPRIL